MSTTFKPEGYNSFSPYFIVDNAAGFLEFLVSVFGGEEKRVFKHPQSNSIVHAEVLIDDSIVMLSNSTEHFPAYNMVLHLYHKDCEEVYKNAIDYGCEGYEPPVRKEGELDIRGTFIDPWGNMWSVGTQLDE